MSANSAVAPIALALVAVVAAATFIARRRRSAVQKDEQGDALTLHQFPPTTTATDGLCLSSSPFCVKTEVFLRWAGIPYGVKYGIETGGNKRLPFVTLHGGHTICDSSAIVSALSASHGVDLDEELGDEERAVALAFQRMIEEHLYFFVVHGRWAEDAGWAQIMHAYGMDKMPWFVRTFILPSVRARIVRNLHGQGVASMDAGQRAARIARDVDALAVYLGDKPFLMGAQRTTVDASLYGLLRFVLSDGVSEAVTQRVRMHPNLVSYVERITAELLASEKPQ